MTIYKACDIRGKFGAELHRHHAEKLAAAVRVLKGPCQVLVGGDGRLSTSALKTTLIESLVRFGCQVTDLGMIPTPLFYFARQKLGIETGIMVTASHNPAADNGFKITLGPQPVTTEEMDWLAQHMESNLPSFSGEPGICTSLNLLPEYIAFLAAHAPDLSGQKVVIDCANGMAGLAARQLWQRTGADVTLLLEEVDGCFPAHPPNPAEVKNLALLQQTVRQAGADLGIAYDGDADRVAFVDETGQPLVSDKVIVLFARDVLQQVTPGMRQTIVYDQKCSRIVPDTIREMGGRPVMELSGHTYIKRTFQTQGAVYAGELSGHHFFRDVGGDDGLAASLFFARIIREVRKPLSGLIAEIPSYPITPDIRLPMAADEIAGLIDTLEKKIAGKAEITRTDGLRIEFADGWGLIRPSVTEPVVTLRFEGVDEAALQKIIHRMREASPLLGNVVDLLHK
jgi:phosphomannomutase / phosphoglucomutase